MPTTDPPFDAAGYDSAAVDEVWSSRADPDRRFESREFSVPDVLPLIVAGYPGKEGILLALEDVNDGTRLTLASPEVGYVWHLVRFAIPEAWVGRRARVISSAEGSAWWIGVTSPYRSSSSSHSAIVLPFLVVLHFLLFLLPGVATLLLIGNELETWARIGLVVTASCLTGYVAFYLYFFSPYLGAATSALVLTGALVIVLDRLRRVEGRELVLSSELCTPIALMLLYSLFAVSLTFVREPTWPEADEIARHRYVRSLPGDNALPQYLAERLWSGLDARRLISGWLSSDRPPLQAGLLLLQHPVADASGSSPSLFAQVAGVVFQSSWIAGTWMLCAASRVRRAVTVTALAAGGMSGFFLLNTAFVWPKMLSGALGLIAVALLVASSRDGWTRRHSVLCATSAALAVLAHAGAVFALAPAALVFAIGRSRPRIRDVSIAIVIAASLFVPWILYQKLYAPPGNRLLMLHLAGVEEESDQSLGEAIVASYRRAGLDTALRTRWENARMLFPSLTASDLRSVERRREAESGYVFGTLCVLNLGWLLLLARLARRKRAPDEIRRLYWLAGSSLALGIAVLFIPNMANVYVASYTAVITLVVLASYEIDALPPLAVISIVALQTAMFVVDWIVLTPPRPAESAIPVASPVLAAAAMIGAAGFLAVCARAAWAGNEGPSAGEAVGC